MSTKSIIVLFFITIYCFVSINTYRLDTSMHPNDIDDIEEPNDPHVLKHIQFLIDNELDSHYGNSRHYNDDYHDRIRRLLLFNRRPGLLRLK